MYGHKSDTGKVSCLCAFVRDVLSPCDQYICTGSVRMQRVSLLYDALHAYSADFFVCTFSNKTHTGMVSYERELICVTTKFFCV